MTVELIRALRAEGGTLARLTHDNGHSAAEPSPAQIASAGPRVAGREQEYELLLEMIFEGSLLHYGTPRVIRTDDRDLALLLGDQLYALGLARLARLGDLDAVATLAEVISQLAQAHAEGEPGRARAIWEAGARTICWGEERPS